MNRDQTIDALKGIAIIGVVTIHSTVGESYFFINSFLDVISKFCVPLFIFISGYFAFKKRGTIQAQFTQYIAGRFLTVGMPYLYMTTLIAICTGQPFSNFAKWLLTGTASVPYYFIIVIFQMYLLSKFILTIYEKYASWLLLTSAILMVMYSGLFYYQLHLSGKIVYPYFMWQFPNYLFWFTLGIEFAARGDFYYMLDKYSKNCLYIMIFALICCLIEIHYLISHHFDDGNYIAFTAIVWEFTAVISLWQYRGYFSKALFVSLGKYSFGIFLIHLPIQDIYFKYFNHVKAPDNAILYIAGTLFISVTILQILSAGRKYIQNIVKMF